MNASRKGRRIALLYGIICFLSIGTGQVFGQSISLNGAGTGRVFDGVGGVSGGGATSVLLMSYPEPYRSQILDYLFKPKFGASMNTLFFEIGGDCNSTQGSEPSHMHTASDLNCQRGYEWWLIKQAKTRNPTLTLDGVAWGCPGWIGGTPPNFWSTDMQNYYVKWIQGLKNTYGIDLDAIGCRNEGGSNYSFAEQFRSVLDAAGFTSVKLHGFDNWGGTKWGFVTDLISTPALANAIDVLSAHTMMDGSATVPANMKALNKPIWDTEEHYHTNDYTGFTQALLEVNAFNMNYIRDQCTKTVFWYLITANYPIESYYGYSVGLAAEPWSGHYEIKPGLWGYAHYGQFVNVGWQFIDGACGKLSGGGTYVTLKSPDNADFSVIIETQNVSTTQTLNFTISGGLPTTQTLCVWMSNGTNQFVKQADITPANGAFSISVAGGSIYSISTTTGQQKGSFSTPIPASAQMPIPFYDNYDHYSDARLFGYLPYYTADICGVFEIANSPTGTGKCLHQVLSQKANSWAPEWAPFTIIGSRTWADYEVSADVYFDGGGWASVMGRLSGTMSGYGAYPQGYYLQLASSGAWKVMYANNTASSEGTQLASGTVALTASQWNNIKLRMQGTTLTAFVKDAQVWTGTASNSSNGLAGLGTGNVSGGRNTAMFDNFAINTPGGATPTPTVFAQDATPPYGPSTSVSAQTTQAHMTPVLTSFKFVGNQFFVPKEFAGKNVAAAVYDLKGRLIQKVTTKNAAINLRSICGKSSDVFIVKLKAMD